MGLSDTSGTSYFSIKVAIESGGFYFQGHAGQGSWSAGAR